MGGTPSVCGCGGAVGGALSVCRGAVGGTLGVCRGAVGGALGVCGCGQRFMVRF